MTSLRLRVRYPDGRSVVLTDVRESTTYAGLLDLLEGNHLQRPTRLFVSGPPPRRLVLQPGDCIMPAVQNGDSLFVATCTPITATPEAKPKPKPNPKATQVAKTEPWVGLRTGAVHRRGRGARGRAHRIGKASFASAGSGRVLETGDIGEAATAAVDNDGADVQSGGRATRLSVEDSMSLAVVTAVDGGGGAAGKLLRTGMQAALAERQKGAEAEGRYSAWLSGQYELKYFSFEHSDGVVVFRVKYLPSGERKWREDPADSDEYFPTWSKKVLGTCYILVVAVFHGQGSRSHFPAATDDGFVTFICFCSPFLTAVLAATQLLCWVPSCSARGRRLMWRRVNGYACETWFRHRRASSGILCGISGATLRAGCVRCFQKLTGVS
jgi:hypothetical protein